MTFEIALLLLLTAAAIVLFSIERISPDVTALSLVIVLVVSGLLKPTQPMSNQAAAVVVLPVAVLTVLIGGIALVLVPRVWPLQ
jgi:di/tricarboxylate transporter